jgi:hypothetical protein
VTIEQDLETARSFITGTELRTIQTKENALAALSRIEAEFAGHCMYEANTDRSKQS